MATISDFGGVGGLSGSDGYYIIRGKNTIEAIPLLYFQDRQCKTDGIFNPDEYWCVTLDE